MKEQDMAEKKPTRREFIGKSTAAAAVAGLALQSGVHAAGSDTIKIGMIGAGGRCTGAAANAMNVDKGVKLVAGSPRSLFDGGHGVGLGWVIGCGKGTDEN
jgi:hypothetical protein